MSYLYIRFDIVSSFSCSHRYPIDVLVVDMIDQLLLKARARNTYTISALQTCSPCRRPDENQPPLLPVRTGPPSCSDLIVKGKDCLFASRNCEERQEACRYSPLPVLRSSPLPCYWLVRFTRAQECRHVLVPEPLAILRFRVRFFITQQKNNVLITGLSTRRLPMLLYKIGAWFDHCMDAKAPSFSRHRFGVALGQRGHWAPRG